jgi:UDP:flavonoid glycosyltransferase YjiC (YdhE family)
MVPLQLPHAANRALWWATRLFLHHLLLGAVNRGRASIGLPPIRSIDEYLFGETPILLATDPVVAPRDPGWPEHWRQVGYLFFDDPMPLDPELDAWLRDGEPPVYVGFGSMSTPDTARVNREVIEAVSRTGHRGLLGAGWAGLGGDGLPAGWKAIAEAPHHRLFPRCGVVVHHGGSGTTANALRAGAAQVLVPHVLDQFYFAHRLEVCGIAPAPVPVASLRGDRLARAIEAATSTGGDARRAAAERIAAADGVGEAALAVEAAVPHHARSRAVGPSVGR